MPEVWPYRPMSGSSETLQWLTSVMQTYNLEQRIALRAYPRQFLNYNCRLEDKRQLARARALAEQIAGTTCYVPVWIEGQYVGTIASGAGSITVDTTAGDWGGNGDKALVWQDDETFEVVTISSVGASALTLSGTTAASYSRAYVVPLRTAITPDAVRFTRHATYADADVVFQVTDNGDLAGSGLANTYSSLDVMVDPPADITSVSEKIIRSTDFVDSGFGIITLEPIESFLRRGYMISWADDTKAQLWARRQWLHELKGKQKTFWMPQFNMDLQATDALGSASQVANVESIGFDAAYTDRHVMVETFSGSYYFRQITGTSFTGTVDQLTMNTTWGANIAIADIKRFCFLTKVRLDSDEVTITYRSGSLTAISVPVVEVPDA